MLKVNKEAGHTFQALVLNNSPLNMLKTNMDKLVKVTYEAGMWSVHEH